MSYSSDHPQTNLSILEYYQKLGYKYRGWISDFNSYKEDYIVTEEIDGEIVPKGLAPNSVIGVKDYCIGNNPISTAELLLARQVAEDLDYEHGISDANWWWTISSSIGKGDSIEGTKSFMLAELQNLGLNVYDQFTTNPYNIINDWTDNNVIIELSYNIIYSFTLITPDKYNKWLYDKDKGHTIYPYILHTEVIEKPTADIGIDYGWAKKRVGQKLHLETVRRRYEYIDGKWVFLWEILPRGYYYNWYWLKTYFSYSTNWVNQPLYDKIINVLMDIDAVAS